MCATVHLHPTPSAGTGQICRAIHARWISRESKSAAQESYPDKRFRVERVTRIELAFSAWEADVLPLNYTREGCPD
jgi:hypothetical protein